MEEGKVFKLQDIRMACVREIRASNLDGKLLSCPSWYQLLKTSDVVIALYDKYLFILIMRNIAVSVDRSCRAVWDVVHGRLNTGNVGSNPSRGMCVYRLLSLLCCFIHHQSYALTLARLVNEVGMEEWRGSPNTSRLLRKSSGTLKREWFRLITIWNVPYTSFARRGLWNECHGKEFVRAVFWNEVSAKEILVAFSIMANAFYSDNEFITAYI